MYPQISQIEPNDIRHILFLQAINDKSIKTKLNNSNDTQPDQLVTSHSWLDTSILVSLNKRTKLTLYSTYCPFCPKISLINFKNYFQSLGKYFIVAGDLNAKHSIWDCFSTNTRSRTLRNIKNTPTPSPLHYWLAHQNRRPDILDIFIAKVPRSCNTNVSNINYLSLDHSPVLLDFEMLSSKISSKNVQAPSNIDWPTFQKLLETSTQLNLSLKSNIDIHNIILKFTTCNALT